MELIKTIFSLIGSFLADFWWVFLTLLLIFVFKDLRAFYKKQKERREKSWSLMEVVPPPEINKTPRAMEQIFAALAEIEDNWASFEIVGRAGATRFFIRIPEDYHNLIESAIYAQYPEAEITPIPEAESYTTQFPVDLPDNNYDVWGTELTLKHADGYPIKTYPEFKEGSKEEEEEVIDPIAGITEIMSKLEKFEAIWLQILVKPADNKKWNKEAQELIDEVMGKKEKEEGLFGWLIPWVAPVGEFIRNLFRGLFEPPEWSNFEEKEGEKKEGTRTKAVEQIENKMAKISFHAAIRFVYIDRWESFTKSNISGVMGAFRQFNTNDLNALEENKSVKTKTEGLLKDRRLESRKKRIFSNYLTRDFPETTSIFNTEELATLYHFPAASVKSPRLKRVPVRKTGPPPDLPVQ